MNEFNTFIEHFHFLRPMYLLAIPLCLLLLASSKKIIRDSSVWTSIIEADLLQHLSSNTQVESKRSIITNPLITLFWITACIALAGPSWQKVNQPVIKKQDALILVLDLSLSMYAEDQKPSRLISAKRKLSDILTQRKEGLTALIVYSGDAHIVSPLTDDVDTISTMLPALEPNIMPKFGSNLISAITESQLLLNNANIKQAQILLLTDEVSKTQLQAAHKLLNDKQSLAILTFGTAAGAPIPLSQGFFKDNSGSTVIAKLDYSKLQKQAHAVGATIQQSQVDDSDINTLLKSSLNNLSIDQQENIESDRQFDLWLDQGHWLTLLLIPFVLISFRRGWILAIFLIVLPDNGYALEWQDLWQTKDQQAAKAFQQGDMEQAANTFNNTEWQASANYKNGQFEQALEGFKTSDSAENFYNQANTLAQMGNYPEAIATYDRALKVNPDFGDAGFNKQLVEELLKQQEQQQQDQQQEQQNSDEKSDQDSEQNSEENSDNNQQQNSESDSEQQNQSDQNQKQNQEQNQEQSQEHNQQQNQEQSQENSDEQEQKNTQQPEDESDQQSEEKQKQAQQEESSEPEGDEQSAEQAEQKPLTPQEKEQQQALQQWLRKIPDDPGQLLKNKFRYQYEMNRQRNEHIDRESEQLW